MIQDRIAAWSVPLLALLLMGVPSAWAQVLPSLGDLPGDLQRMQRQAAQRAAAPLTLSLEGAVDPAAYVVGPGDQFTVAIGGSFAQEQFSTVSADGYLLIPEVGRFAVAGLVLSKVDDLIRPALRRVYRNVPAELALTQPRQFYVHVSGAVTKPGRHLVGPIARVEDAVRAAMDDQNPLTIIRQIERMNAATGEQRPYPALRNVRVNHQDGSTSQVDLRSYYATGEREHNPFLLDGDVVLVPSFEPFRNAVFVDGPVLSPGVYDFRAGDTVESLLAVAAGTADVETLGTVRLVRADGTMLLIELNPSGVATPVSPGDRVIVEPAAPDLGSVSVDGRVRYPGEYTVRVGRTTVAEVIEMAGGLRQDALPQAAVLERRGSGRSRAGAEERDAAAALAWDVMTERSPTQAEIELRLQEEAFRELRLANLDFASRQYLLGELRRTPRMALDLQSGSGNDVTLRDGDRIVVPADIGGIYVFGQVAQSGFIPYSPGLRADEYVRRAGGTTSAATDVYVRRAGSGQVVPAREADMIRPGDAVFVDRRAVADSAPEEQLRVQERMLRAQERQQWLQIGTAILTTATALATAIIFSRR